MHPLSPGVRRGCRPVIAETGHLSHWCTWVDRLRIDREEEHLLPRGRQTQGPFQTGLRLKVRLPQSCDSPGSVSLPCGQTRKRITDAPKTRIASHLRSQPDVLIRQGGSWSGTELVGMNQWATGTSTGQDDLIQRGSSGMGAIVRACQRFSSCLPAALQTHRKMAPILRSPESGRLPPAICGGILAADPVRLPYG